MLFYFTVDGGWGDWVMGKCSKTCGGGTKNITRKCNNPKPSCGGKQCDGASYYPYPGRCNSFQCPSKTVNVILLQLIN